MITIDGLTKEQAALIRGALQKLVEANSADVEELAEHTAPAFKGITARLNNEIAEAKTLLKKIERAMAS